MQFLVTIILQHALPMQYLNDESWVVSIDVDAASIPAEGIEYNYVLKSPG